MSRGWAAAVVAVVLTSLAACGVVTRDASVCLPSPLRVTPDRAAPGQTVTVSAGAFRCVAEYPPGTQYTFLLTPPGGGAVELGTSGVRRDGSFTTQVTVPPTMPAGAADLWVKGSLFDRACRDTEGGSCAGYSTLITITS